MRRRYRCLADIPKFSPAPLRRFPEPFDDPDWLYELKYDGFRALAYVRAGGVELRSRTDHVYRQFAQRLRTSCAASSWRSMARSLDEHGRTQFDALMYRRAAPCFVAFDVLWNAGTDLRMLPLWKRKPRRDLASDQRELLRSPWKEAG